MPEGDETVAIATEWARTEEEPAGSNPHLAHLDELVRYAYALVGSVEEAEDVAMETIQAAMRVRGGLASMREPKLYLLGIARRKVADALRRRRRQRGAGTVSFSDPDLLPLSTADDGTPAAVGEVLGRLSHKHRDVLLLKYAHGLTAAEIANVMGRSPSGVNSLLQRAREAFVRAGGDLLTTE